MNIEKKIRKISDSLSQIGGNDVFNVPVLKVYKAPLPKENMYHVGVIKVNLSYQIYLLVTTEVNFYKAIHHSYIFLDKVYICNVLYVIVTRNFRVPDNVQAVLVLIDRKEASLRNSKVNVEDQITYPCFLSKGPIFGGSFVNKEKNLKSIKWSLENHF